MWDSPISEGAISCPNRANSAMSFWFKMNSSLVQVLQKIMRHQGFDARSFTNPFEALSAAAAEAPELLFSDLAMPHALRERIGESSAGVQSGLQSAPFLGARNGTLGKYNRLGQRVQIRTMLRPPPDFLKRVNAESEFAY